MLYEKCFMRENKIPSHKLKKRIYYSERKKYYAKRHYNICY